VCKVTRFSCEENNLEHITTATKIFQSLLLNLESHISCNSKRRIVQNGNVHFSGACKNVNWRPPLLRTKCTYNMPSDFTSLYLKCSLAGIPFCGFTDISAVDKQVTGNISKQRNYTLLFLIIYFLLPFHLTV